MRDETQSTDSMSETNLSLENQDQLEGLKSGDPRELQIQIATSYARFERDFRRRYPFFWWFTLFSPMIIFGGTLSFIGVVWGFDLARNYLIAGIVTFVVLGRFVILGGTEKEQLEGFFADYSLSPFQLFSMVTIMDFAVALFVAFHIGFMFRLPWLGPKVSMLVSDGKYLMEKQPWIKRLSFIGLICFVVFPSSTTGSIGGSIFGRLLGFGRVVTVLGVLIGSLIGNGLMLFFAKQINRIIPADSVWIKLIGVAIIVFVLVFLEWRFQRVKKKYERLLKQ